MTEKFLVSILIPAFNVQDYVEEAMNSLLNQTYVNIEIVVVDDASTDDTLKILRELECKDNRVKVYSNLENKGIVDTMNFGIKFCTGDFIARMDADDIAMPYRIEKQLKYLIEHPEVDIVGSSTITINMRGEGNSISHVPVGKKKIEKTLLIFSPCFHIWLARRKVYDSLSGYRPLAPAEDYDFLLRATTHGFVINNIDQPLMKIRCRDGNTADIAGIKQRKAHYYVIELFKRRIKYNTLEDGFHEQEYRNALGYSETEKKHYDFSVSLIKKGFSQKNRIKKNLYFIASVFSSKWQMKYALNRLMFKFKLKFL